MAVGTFVVGTDAFVMAGVLPDVAGALRISLASAGQIISVFSVAYALLSPVLAALTANWTRRVVLVTALSVFAAGNMATALAPSYAWVLAARIVAAAGAAMFTPNASAIAADLAGMAGRGKAIAVVTSGLTASLVLGAPLGTAIGNTLGWRATMWFVTALAVLVVPAIAIRLPAIEPVAPVALSQRLAPLADRRVMMGLTGTVLVFTGIY
ncbi:MFS transporter, partial [Streptomyces sp900116325]|uniref:MFS transporter n=1 Tax=Streptomyces sp. 900116325 TaxID=3154295 RepID=UPI0033DCD8A8